MNSNLRWAVPAKTILAVSLALVGAAAGAQSASGSASGPESDLARRLDQLAAELAAVKAELVQLRQVNAQAAAQAAAPAAVAATAPLAPTPAEVAPAVASSPATVLTSYGEINYSRPTRASQNTVFDMRRFVLGYQHRVDERTKIVAELEIEHGVSSAGDPGEVAIEQAYVERQLNATYALRAGLFLMPIGLLNENHEPTAFYGVERNFVETAIIPSTWREGGVQFVGNYDNGLTAQGGISSSFDLNKWNPKSPDGKTSPLGSIHQELALAKGHDLAGFGALNWRGVPGLLLGGALFSGQATQAQAAAKARVTLWDVHARWTPGRWDLSALYTRGSISNTAALNAALIGNVTLIPKSFDGAYVQGAYKVWSQGDYTLSPFVRLEQFNTASSYADLGPGVTPDAQPAERVATVGANFQFAPGIVLKADYQRFRVNPDLNRFNLGLGWSF